MMGSLNLSLSFSIAMSHITFCLSHCFPFSIRPYISIFLSCSICITLSDTLKFSSIDHLKLEFKILRREINPCFCFKRTKSFSVFSDTRERDWKNFTNLWKKAWKEVMKISPQVFQVDQFLFIVQHDRRLFSVQLHLMQRRLKLKNIFWGLYYKTSSNRKFQCTSGCYMLWNNLNKESLLVFCIISKDSIRSCRSEELKDLTLVINI